MKPHPQHGFWYASSSWLMIHRPSATRGSKVWNRIISSWKLIVKHIEPIPPKNPDEVLNTNLWWTTKYIGANFHFPIARARTLARVGLRYIKDVWDLTLKGRTYDHWFKGSFPVTQCVTVLEPVMYEKFYFYFSEMKVHVFYPSQKFQIFL